MKIFRFALSSVFLLLILTCSALAGLEKGNGGDAVLRSDGKIFLFDLFEAGSEEHPLFGVSSQRTEFERALAPSLNSLGVSKELLSAKLGELKEVDAGLAYGVLFAISAFDWHLVHSPLKEVDDANTPLDLRGGKLLQAAVRVGQSILIQQELWRLLDEKNRVALVMHEALYALIKPEISTTTDGTLVFEQSSPRVRRLNAYLFSADLRARGSTSLHFLMGDLFPKATWALPLGNPAIKGEFMTSPVMVLSDSEGTVAITPETPVQDSSAWIERKCRRSAIPGQRNFSIRFQADRLLLSGDYYGPGPDPRSYIRFEVQPPASELRNTIYPESSAGCNTARDYSQTWFSLFTK